MCGISGVCNISNPRPVRLNTIGRMTYSLNHRGPDEAGAYIDDWIGMGQSRLSIIDILSGQQPIHNEDKTLWIIYNGEVFNYPELRQELTAKGHKFYTSTDTEVILHLFEEKQEKCLDYLNGQFAFAIWDSEKKELFLARDRVGIIPLFYTITENRLLFASEVKAIFAADEIDRQIDVKSLNQIFTFWSTLPGRTVFTGINELPPAHYLKLKEGKVLVKKYWEYPFPESGLSGFTTKNLLEDLHNLLQDSIRIRLRADVPVGSYLSGGIDSSGITSMTKKHFNNELKTFGIEFEDPDFDERTYQVLMKKDLDVSHVGLRVSNKDIGKNFEKALFHIEKPLLRAAPVPLFLLSKEVNSKKLKVVLTGEGADEIFGGYNIFKETKIRNYWSGNPDSKIRPLLLTNLYPYIFKDKRLKNTLMAFFGRGLDDPDNPWFSHMIRWDNTGKLKNYLSEDFRLQQDNDFDELADFLPSGFYKQDYLTKAQYLEIITFMSGYLLSSQGDRVAMANSVEIRVPYLDHRIIEFMAGVYPALKINGLNEKYLLKLILKEYLPPEIVKRSKKPYRSPIKRALLSPGNDLYERYCTIDKIKAGNIFDYSMVDKLFTKARRSGNFSELNDMALAGIFSTQIIRDIFIDNFNADEPPAKYFKTLFDNRKSISEE